jgi:branched-chain amino acid transport system substrate-binding protein
VIRQARSLGIKADFTGTAALQSVDLIKIAGPAAEGVAFPTPWDPSLDTPANKKFVADYQAKYSADPGIWVTESYVAIKLVAQAIANAKSTKRQAIRDALAKIKGMDSPYGSLTIVNRIPTSPGVKMVIQNGKFVYQGKLG